MCHPWGIAGPFFPKGGGQASRGVKTRVWVITLKNAQTPGKGNFFKGV